MTLIKSMTGYGRAVETVNGREFTVELRSVNNRYLDCTVKMPRWIRDFSGADLQFSFTSGGDFPEDLQEYALVVHCGGCMLNEAEMKHRLSRCRQANVPVVNYGIAIAQIHGILCRSLAPFPDLSRLL